MRPKAKYAVIHRHANEYPVSVMCAFFGVSRSGYYDFVKRMGKPERDAELAAEIRKCQIRSDNTYGYPAAPTPEKGLLLHSGRSSMRFIQKMVTTPQTHEKV